MKHLNYLLLALSFYLASCSNNKQYNKELQKLKLKFGGEWSMSEYEACPLVVVENSERIRNAPDSIQFYIDEIYLSTQNIEPRKCLNLEVRNEIGNSVISATQSDIYVLR